MIRGPRRTGSAVLIGALLAVVGCAPQQAPQGAVIVVVDTLRADALGLYGAERPTSPRLDALAAEAAVFEQAVAPSPWTLPSVASLLTGKLPAEHRAGTVVAGEGRSTFLPLRVAMPTLAQILAAEGFATGAVMNNPFLRPKFGVAAGFQSYDHVSGNRREIRTADRVVDRALDWLSERGEGRFLLLVHLFDPHLNYSAPEPFRGAFAGDEALARDVPLQEMRSWLKDGTEVPWDRYRAAYEEEVAFVDLQLGRLLDGIEDVGLGGRTLVWVTSDHGEEFLDHGGFEHGHSMYQELLRVPLLAAGPGVKAARVRSPVSLVDIAPTALEALGVEAPVEFDGVSLWPALTGREEFASGRTIWAENPLYGKKRRAVIRWPWKLIRTEGPLRFELYDLETDPGESRNLARRERRIVDELRSAFADRPLRDPVAAEGVGLDDDTAEDLRSLGYIQ